MFWRAVALQSWSGKWRKAVLIDWHSHHTPPEVVERIAQWSGKIPVSFNDDDSTDFSKRIKEMDEAGVDIQLVCQGSAAISDQLPADQALEIAHWTNDLIAERISPYSSRLIGVIAVSLKSIEGAIKEIERMSDRGFRAVQLYPRVDGGEMLDCPVIDPILAKISALDLPIFLHGASFSPTSPRVQDPTLKRLEDNGMGVICSVIADSDVGESAVRMIASGVFDRYPNLRVVIRSAGGGLPLILNRLFWKHKGPHGERPYSEILLDHFLVDTAGMTSGSLKFLMETLGDDRLVFGSDYCGGPGPVKKALPALDEHPRPDYVRKILERNARRLLRI